MNLEKSFTGQKFISHSFGLIIRSASGSVVRVILVPVKDVYVTLMFPAFTF